ncbi:MAG: response regulator transcription factor [Clostridiales bacterium]|nr:response regulator transcription factor [Clostridiales bacterium]
MSRILISDDDKDIVRALRIYLKAENPALEITEAYDGLSAMELLRKNEYDLLITDVMMPGKDGFEVLSELREFSDMPVILLTAKGEAEDKRLAFRMGTDDYITKPFNKIEVAARVEYQLGKSVRRRREEEKKADEICNGPIVINESAKSVTVDGSPVSLTPTEFAILKFLTQNAGAVYSLKDIYKNIWGGDPMGSEGTVLVHIRHIREKIEIYPAKPRYLLSVFGYGYKVEKMD